MGAGVKISVPFLGSSKELLEAALSRGRKAAGGVGKVRDPLKRVKTVEMARVNAFHDYLKARLKSVSAGVPTLEELHAFYRELLEQTIEVKAFKQALGHVEKSTKLLESFKRACKKGIYSVKTEKDAERIKKSVRMYLGRTASVLRSLDSSIERLESTRKKLAELPVIDLDAPTIILAGYPNTGKTTLLKRLTGSRAAIASYPFTTTSIQVSSFEWKHAPVQVIDTPGLLDREMEKRNAIERKAVAALTHLNGLIVFIVDPTPYSGYELEKQMRLLSQVARTFSSQVIVLINKADLAREGDVKRAQAALKGRKVFVEGANSPSTLKEWVGNWAAQEYRKSLAPTSPFK
ncbi:MAG: 50S ribosome-binding GTPase [Candidatus Diapherotrites archaeon]|nr:50S ribosome-binding GTPase [Candidatus Diapherotrites archaeon]